MIWKEISGFKGKYEASSCGTIRNTETKNILSGSLTESGYLRVCLKLDGKWKCYKVHRIIAETFVSNPYNKREINHKNGIKTDNRIENLEWVNHDENMHHAWENGLIQNAGRKRKTVVNIINGEKHIYKDTFSAAKELNIPIDAIRLLCRLNMDLGKWGYEK